MTARFRTLAAIGVLATTALVANAPAASAATLSVDTTTDSVDIAPGDGTCADAVGDCSLRAAVQEANASAGPDSISLAEETYVLTIAGAAEGAAATGDLDVTSEITLTSPGVALIDASTLGDRAFEVAAGATFRLDHVGITGGTAVDVPTASGGAVLNAGTFEATEVQLLGNTANRAGGGIEASAGSSTTLVSTTLLGNVTGPTPGNGGGLHLTGAGTIVVTDSFVSANEAANEGGGLWNSSVGTMTITGTEIDRNTAAGPLAANGGGGVFNQPSMDATTGGTVTITDSSIHDNAATGAAGSGGGVFNSRGTLTITDTDIAGNTAVRAGGGIEALAGTTTVTDTDFTANLTGSAPGNGGAIHLTGPGAVSINGGTATQNRAANEGGAFWNSSTGTMTITDVDIAANRADGDSFTAPDFEGGGGVFNDGSAPEVGPPVGGTLTVTASRITDNTATVGAGSGGGILNVFGTLTVTDTVVEGNESARAGGGIETNGGTTTVERSALDENRTGASPGNGGGLHLTGAGTVAVTDSSVRGNEAANEGGGLWSSAAGSMTVERSRIVANSALGAAPDSGGGGLYNDGGTLTASNTVVVGNDAGTGGGVLDVGDGDTTLIHVTVTDNDAASGSGVASLGDTITLANSIVAANTGGTDCVGATVSLGGNVVGDCASGTDDSAGIDDPELDADLVPEPGSPAIDAGLEANSLPTDLAGTSRPLDGDADGVATSDAGALEAPGMDPVDPPPTTTPPTTTPPTTAPAPTTTVVPAPPTTTGAPTAAAASTGTLPVTGGTTGPLFAGAALALAGGLLAALSRRRRLAEDRR